MYELTTFLVVFEPPVSYRCTWHLSGRLIKTTLDSAHGGVVISSLSIRFGP